MDNNSKKNQSENHEAQPYSLSDEVTKEKINKHLSDINDVITEEDIANVKVPGEEEPLPPRLSDRDYEKKDDDKGENLTERKPITPWDVID